MVTLPWRRRRLPADRSPALEAEERIVAWAGALADATVVATNRGLWLSTVAPDATRWVRIGWHEIHKATWSGRELSIVTAAEVAQEESYAVMADQSPLVLTLVDPDGVPDQVRARVNRSVAYTSHHPLPGGGGVRVVARRVAGVNGVRWSVRYDRAADAADPDVALVTGELVAAARSAIEPAEE
ncbi:MAG TPA: hypothetical protein VK453_25900 [Micromonosporaceae bacterium]|nr:hypothetical protein [Micromonosporaceae bacterium]